jgi:hypothetical protein
LPIIPEVEEMLISLRKTSLPSARSALAASRQLGASARATRKGTTVWISQHRLELLVAHLVGDAVPGVAGVVDDDVDGAEGVDRGGDHLVGGTALGQVAGEDRGLAVDLARGLLGDVAVEVVDENLGALAGEQLRGGAANAARRPGHDRRFPVQKSLRSTSPLVRAVGGGGYIEPRNPGRVASKPLWRLS